MDAIDRAFAEDMQAAGFVLTGGDFLTGPAVFVWVKDRPAQSRTCYEFTGGRWEGFATLEYVDEPRPAHWGAE